MGLEADDARNEDDPAPRSLRAVWAGGSEARALAECLTDGTATRAGANLSASCIDSRADLLVLSNRASLDLCSVAVPHGFNRESVASIVAAVGGGPHSGLAATIADQLSGTLDVPACAVFGYSDPSELSQAHTVLSRITARLPELDSRTVEASSPAAMVSALPAGTLLVVGAPGGSWFQRRFFGPGARIQARASGGTVVVNHSPPRVYQVMRPPIAFGPKMRVADAVQLSEGLDIMVAERGKLLGRASIGTLRNVRPELEVHQVMDTDVFLSVSDRISDAIDLVAHYGDGLVPVIDDQSYLVGCVSAADLSTKPIV